MTDQNSGSDIVERALAVLDAECQAWAARRTGAEKTGAPGEATPVEDPS